MSVTTTVQDEKATQQAQERGRLVDHFKRAYQIIVGLSITIACGALFPNQFITVPPDKSFWLFGAFFVTVVPIFQGGDRSLDIKYFHHRPRGFWGHASYVWDVYMLLITAILFVKIAQSIPVPVGTQPSILNPSPHTSPQNFYLWMSAMLFFDAVVLVIDGFKSSFLTQAPAKLASYAFWFFPNVLLGMACIEAPHPGTFLPFTANLSDATIALAIFALAALRSFIDYIVGYEFLFP